MSSDLATRLAAVRESIALNAGERARAVRLVVVTKSAPATIFAELADLGVSDLGENRVQGAAQRLAGFETAFRWHFIGHLQSNKARAAVALFDVFHGVDSLSLLKRLDRVAGELQRRPELLLQVNISGETSKSGFSPADLPEALALVTQLSRVRVSGLMTMAPRCEDPETARAVFRGLARLGSEARQQLAKLAPGLAPGLDQLSMGMTDDYMVALQEGATMVRVGRRIVAPEQGSPGQGSSASPGPRADVD